MSSLEDLISSGPPAAASTQNEAQPRPIGIPQAFQAPGAAPRAPYFTGNNGLLPNSNPDAILRNLPPVREPYYDGAEHAPRSLSAEKRAQLQQAMAQAGLISANQTYRLGVWDEVSVKAYRDVLSFANQGGIDVDSALAELLSSPLRRGDGAAGSLDVDPGKATQLTDAVTLEQQVQQTARDLLGRKLRTNEAARFTTLYQAMQKRDADQRNAAQTALTAGQDVTVTDIPSMGVASEQFVESRFADEAAGQSTLGYLDALKSLVGS